MKFNRFTKFFYKHFPSLLLRDAADEAGVDYKNINKLQDAFGDAECIEMHPLGENGDFQIIIDKKIALYFYAAGSQKYIYDGFEIGDYS